MVGARRTVCTKSGFLRIFKTQYGTVFISLSLFFFRASRAGHRQAPVWVAQAATPHGRLPEAVATCTGAALKPLPHARNLLIRHSAVAAVLVVVVQ